MTSESTESKNLAQNTWLDVSSTLYNLTPPRRFLNRDTSGYQEAKDFLQTLGFELDKILTVLRADLRSSAGVGLDEDWLKPSDYIHDFILPDYDFAISTINDELRSPE